MIERAVLIAYHPHNLTIFSHIFLRQEVAEDTAADLRNAGYVVLLVDDTRPTKE